MASKPDDRFPTPRAVMAALLPFLQTEVSDRIVLAPAEAERDRARSHFDLASDAEPRPYRILVVDDEVAMRQFCHFALDAEGLDGRQAENGKQALELLAREPFDLVLLDLCMPGMSGLEVLRRLRAQPPCPHLKVILFSGQSTAEEMHQALSAGADDYL